MSVSGPVIGYTLHGKRCLNVTDRCTLRCRFCPKFKGRWAVADIALRLRREPDVSAILAAADNAAQYNEVVFRGVGESSLRLYDVLEVGARLAARGARVRLNTDGLASLVQRRDVTPDLEGNVGSLSVSLNAQDEATYNRLCRPRRAGAHAAVLDFVRRARDYVPHITLTAIDGVPGVDLDARAEIADRLGVGFRRRVLSQVGWLTGQADPGARMTRTRRPGGAAVRSTDDKQRGCETGAAREAA